MKESEAPKINIREELKIFRRIVLIIFILGLSLFGVIAVCYMDDEVSGSGTVEGIRDYAIKTLVDAKASAIFKKAGDFVRAGDKLMEFDARDQKNKISLIENEIRELEIAIGVKEKDLVILEKDPLPSHYRHTELELKEARERFLRSKMELESYTSLYEKKAVSKHEFLQVEMEHISKKMNLERLEADWKKLQTGLAADIVSKAREELSQLKQQLVGKRAQLEMERKRLADYVILAPDTGIITEIPPRPGNYYTQGTVVVQLAANQNKKVIALISENQIYKVRSGQRARIACSQYNYLDYGYFWGEVEYVCQLPEVIDGQKFYPVKLLLISEPYPLRFGSSCKTVIITGRERILFALLGIRSQDYLLRRAEGMIRKAQEKPESSHNSPVRRLQESGRQ